MRKQQKRKSDCFLNDETLSNIDTQQQSSTSLLPSSSPPTIVWFVLLDSATGESYKGTTADYVSLPPDSVIAQFRDAVQLKYDKPNYLKDIPSGVLLVYKNRATFDKRNVPNDPEGKPLEEDSFISGLGKSKKEALVVIVPSSISMQFLQSPPPLSFIFCKVPFYQNIGDAIENDGWVWFEQDIPSTLLNKLYIRESYQTIASSIIQQSGINKIIITGTPGIGKSLFLMYLLWKLVKKGRKVLFIYDDLNIYYDGQGGVFLVETIPTSVHQTFWNKTLWCLFDSKNKTIMDLSKIPYHKCNFLLSTSPRREMLNDFKKPYPVPQIFYMPLWNQYEIAKIAPMFPHATEWQKRFDILGGIPRYVFEDISKTPIQILEAACTECSLDDCVKKIGIDSIITEKSKVIHSLIHMTSTPPFTESSVSYASQTALDIIVRNKGLEARNKMRNLLASCEGNPLTAELCGYVFEPYAIELLEKGGTFTCRQLVHGNTRNIPREMELYIPSSEKIIVDSLLPGQPLNQLHVPASRNNPAIDAWIPGIGAFQMTVGKKHDIRGCDSHELENLGQGANKLYWLLPPLYYYSFTKKTPQNIDQYAVLIEYPRSI